MLQIVRANYGGARLFLAVAGLISVLVDPSETSAQVLYGSIVGTVTDQSNAVVPRARVKVTNSATGLSREAETDSTGYYSISNLPEGSFDATITGTGFRTSSQTNVDVRINTVTRVDMIMQVGAVSETVNVQASAALLQTTRADVSTSLGTRAIENLPLSGCLLYTSPSPRDS